MEEFSVLGYNILLPGENQPMSWRNISPHLLGQRVGQARNLSFKTLVDFHQAAR
jgi:hypothetical protein